MKKIGAGHLVHANSWQLVYRAVFVAASFGYQRAGKQKDCLVQIVDYQMIEQYWDAHCESDMCLWRQRFVCCKTDVAMQHRLLGHVYHKHAKPL